MLQDFTWFKESTYRWAGDDLTVYVDTWGASADPRPADVVFITHAHFDHFDLNDIETIRTDHTTFVAPRDVAAELSGDVVAVLPGDAIDVRGIKGQAVPAYNIAEQRLEAHPKENGWVGYVLEFGDTTYYFTGDTDHLPELEQVEADCVFVCVGGDPYVMNAREAGGLVRAIQPQLAVPNHYGYPIGSPADAEAFRAAADPVKVETMTPVVPFDRS